MSLVIVLSESRHCEASIAADTVLEMTLQKARTQDSAKAFMEGLCGGTHTYTDKAGAAGITGHDRHVQINSRDFHGNYTIHAKPKEHDPVLRFFDMCPAYDDYVAKVDAEFLVKNCGAAAFLKRQQLISCSLQHSTSLDAGRCTASVADSGNAVGITLSCAKPIGYFLT